MKIAGFSFIRNAIKYDYPVVESLTSILPLCDELVVAVGNSEDETLTLVQSIDSPKIKIIETIWDDSLREGGKVLAQETGKALAAISPDADWAFYIQADEVLHEKYIPVIQTAMQRYLHQPEVEALLLNYLHFYGSYRYIGDSRRWYRREIRIIKNTGNVLSYRDAQGFRKGNNQKLCVKLIDATMYHYGWVKPPEKQQEKIGNFNRLWHGDKYVHDLREKIENFDYSEIDALQLFEETHPATMHERIKRMNWAFDFDIQQKKYSFKNRILMKIEALTGWRIGEYRNYTLLD